MIDLCSTPYRTWLEGELCCWWRHEAFLRRRYATSHLIRLCRSGEQCVIYMRRGCQRVESLRDVHRFSNCCAGPLHLTPSPPSNFTRGLEVISPSANQQQHQRLTMYWWKFTMRAALCLLTYFLYIHLLPSSWRYTLTCFRFAMYIIKVR